MFLIDAIGAGLAAGQQPGCGPNPRTCGTSQALAFSPLGGLDAAARAESRFAPASVVTVRAVRFAGPARIEAFHGTGVAGTQMMTAPRASNRNSRSGAPE